MARLALVVDDSMLIRHTICRYLEGRGFRVEAASNGAEAQEMLQGVHPDIIFTDLSMPGMDGQEFIGAIKSRPETAGIPVVILTAQREPETNAQYQADYLIFKDIDIVAQLGRAIAALLPSGASAPDPGSQNQ